jgi:hypothetical protein
VTPGPWRWRVIPTYAQTGAEVPPAAVMAARAIAKKLGLKLVRMRMCDEAPPEEDATPDPARN